MRRLLCVFLLMLLPLHSFAVQGGWLSAGKMSDVAHEVEHLEAASHHHDNHGAVHYDESGESAAHSEDHSACQQSMSLPFAGMPLLTIQPIIVKLLEPAYYIPDPFLEDPQRPPAILG